MLTAQRVAVERGAPVAAESVGCRCSWPRTSTTPHHGEWGSELNHTATIRRTPTPHAAGTQYFAMDVDEVPAAGGSRPDRLAPVSGPQERVQRHFVEQLVEPVRGVPVLDAPVPQMVDHLVDVLKIFDRGLTEQVIEVPKVTLQDVVPERAVRPCQSRSSWHAVGALLVPSGTTSLRGGGGEATGGAPPPGIHRQPRAVFKYWAGLRPLWTSL